MKKIKGRLFSWMANFLTLSIVTSYVAACAPKTDDPEVIEPYDPIVYDSNGVELDEYKIVYSAEAGETTVYAAQCLQEYLEKATGITVSITADTAPATGTEILLGKTNRAESGTVSYDGFGEEGYRIKSVENNLLIAANDSRGMLYGVYGFLEALGYRFYTYSVETTPMADDVFVPEEIDLSWNPVFDYREIHMAGTWDAAYATKKKVNGNYFRADMKTDAKYGGYSGYIGGYEYMCHSFEFLLPAAKYFDANREYYALVDGGRKTTQPCFTSQGAADVIYEESMKLIASDRTSNVINLSQNDNNQFCECENCLESYEKYGYSGTLLNFVNPIAQRLKQSYPDIIVETLAYSETSDIPKGGVVAAENVAVKLCRGPCDYHQTAECERWGNNERLLKAWSKVCNRIVWWYYCINWANLFAALPNYESLYAAVQMFKENNVKGLYFEAAPWEQPEFGELRGYLIMKLMENPNMTKGEYYYHMEDFLYGYYGEGAEYIKEYIDLTYKTIVDYSKTHQEPQFWHGPDSNFNFVWDDETKCYDDATITFIDTCNELWDAAEELANYEQIGRVQKSRIHWTYIELYNTFRNRYKYGTVDEREELVERNKQLYADIFKYGTTKKNINNSIDPNVELFELSPDRW